MKKITRRVFLATFGGLSLPAIAGVDGLFVEPTWLKVRRIKLTSGETQMRLVHFSDTHFKGNHDYMGRMIMEINALEDDFVCFTGDLIEKREFQADILSYIERIEKPVYGVPGNHDYWSGADFEQVAGSFKKTGGAVVAG